MATARAPPPPPSFLSEKGIANSYRCYLSFPSHSRTPILDSSDQFGRCNFFDSLSSFWIC